MCRCSGIGSDVSFSTRSRIFENAIDPRRKFGVRSNGIALMVAWCIEAMQNPEGIRDED
jgi:hypothetical protein